jgi:hypothetical protein
MDQPHGELLPGSQTCVGCGGMTFRKREDSLCPRCAFDAESLIERIELDGLDRDLQLITEFEAYYRQRERDRERFEELKRPVFGERTAQHDLAAREPARFTPDPFWVELRDAG